MMKRLVKLLLASLLLQAAFFNTVLAAENEVEPNDVFTNLADVTLGADFEQAQIAVAGVEYVGDVGCTMQNLNTAQCPTVDGTNESDDVDVWVFDLHESDPFSVLITRSQFFGTPIEMLGLYKATENGLVGIRHTGTLGNASSLLYTPATAADAGLHYLIMTTAGNQQEDANNNPVTLFAAGTGLALDHFSEGVSAKFSYTLQFAGVHEPADGSDTTPPVVTLNGDSVVNIDQGETYAELGATATDDVDSSVTVTLSGSVNTAVVGAYVITYTATDSSGNESSVTRTVNVLDITAPVVTLNGAGVMNLDQGETYTELGATATDDVDSSVTVTLSGSVNTAVAGVYVIAYTATDTAGNSSAVIRTVNVLDITAPVITLIGDSVINLDQGETYTELGATATDAVEGSVTAIPSGSVNTAVVGTYVITYTATDSSGNSSFVTRTVNVLDITAPVITLNGASVVNLNLGQGETYTELGATATDNVDSSVTVIPGGSVNTAVLGTYVITYTAIDSAGNSSFVTRTVNVLDITAPIVTLNGDSVVNLDQGETYTELGATVTDDVDSSVTVIISGSVDTDDVGTYVITYTATDSSGNSSFVTRTVNVLDITAPVVTLNWVSVMNLDQGDTYTELGATATDDIDSSVAVIISGSVDTDDVGVYVITYTATDSSGNESSVTRTVNVVDYSSSGAVSIAWLLLMFSFLCVLRCKRLLKEKVHMV